VSGVDAHRAAVNRALGELGLGWDAWPDAVNDPRLTPEWRVSAVLVLLATDVGDEQHPGELVAVSALGGEEATGLDRLGRARQPWQQLARTKLRWDADSATMAVRTVTTLRHYDERRFALALRAAKEICAAGRATADLVDALRTCVIRLDLVGDEQHDVEQLRRLARRVLASATPPDILDLSLLVPGDAWVGPAREAAVGLPADEITPLVRLLGELGPRKPSKQWLDEMDPALRTASARWLVRRWLELAARADIVPEWPGRQVGECLGILFIGTNGDVVRAVVWATALLPDEAWPAELLGVLARRGSAHNGAPGHPEALALKVAHAAVDVMSTRAGQADRQVLVELHEDLQRGDLLKKVIAALG
jgi:hypothetical protein